MNELDDLLALPVNPSVRIGRAETGSYKNPGRLLVRTADDRVGWAVWYYLLGHGWQVGEVTRGNQGTALVLDFKPDKSLGINPTIADYSRGLVTAADVHHAENFGIFLVSPGGGERSAVWWCLNDKYVPVDPATGGPPWVLQANGVPKKASASFFPPAGAQYPPGYSPPGPPPPPREDGRDWPYEVDGAPVAPVLVSTPTGEMSAATHRDWIDRIYPQAVLRAKTDGTNTPWMGMWRPEWAELISLNHTHGKVTWIWLVTEDGGSPQLALDLLDRLIAHLDTVPHGLIVVEPTWDVFQARGFEDEATVNNWLRAARAHVGSRKNILVGARARPQDDYSDGDFRCWEDHIDEPGDIEQVFLEEIARAPDELTANTERFRARLGGADKEWLEADFPRLCRLSRQHRVAIVIAVEDGRGNVSDYGTGFFSDPDAIAQALGQTPGNGDEEMSRINLTRHHQTRIKIAPAGIADPAKKGQFIWEDGARYEMPLNNDRPWSVYMFEVFDGVLRGWAEEYHVGIDLWDGTKWHRVVTPREEKEGGLQSGTASASSHNAWIPIQLLRAYDIPANSKWRVKVAHNISGNIPHVEVDLHAEEL